VLVSVALALVVPSGALTKAGVGGDRVADELILYPGPDSPYARQGADGEVVVDLTAANPQVEGDGVNRRGRTHLEGAIIIRYTGDRRAHVWLTHESPAVVFTARGRRVESAGAGVTLDANESVAVGLVLDTTGDQAPQVDSLRVHARLASDRHRGEETDDGSPLPTDEGWEDDRPSDSRSPTPTPSGTPGGTGTPGGQSTPTKSAAVGPGVEDLSGNTDVSGTATDTGNVAATSDDDREATTTASRTTRTVARRTEASGLPTTAVPFGGLFVLACLLWAGRRLAERT
jgi:hypothetical protein